MLYNNQLIINTIGGLTGSCCGQGNLIISLHHSLMRIIMVIKHRAHGLFGQSCCFFGGGGS
jgi:hypothetical protein